MLSMYGEPWFVLPAAAIPLVPVLNLVYICVAGGKAFLKGERMRWFYTRATAVVARRVQIGGHN